MYFPFLRGKQNELLAIREAAPTLVNSGRIFPIIEPLDADPSRLVSALRRIDQRQVGLAVVVNPTLGDLAGDVTTIPEALRAGGLLQSPRILPALAVGATTLRAEVAALLAEHGGREVLLVHVGQYRDPAGLNNLLQAAGNVRYNVFSTDRTSAAYRRSFPAIPSVALRDCFVRQVRNADYPEEDFFTDRHQSYVAEGFAGFGDFLTVGDVLPGGGPPRAVTIHLTYAPNPAEIRVRHFVSDRRDTIDDPGGKFLEALEKLIQFARANPMPYSSAIPEFSQLRVRQHFPTLGPIKKLSLRHHLELMAHLL
jgi:hypothetical protein